MLKQKHGENQRWLWLSYLKYNFRSCLGMLIKVFSRTKYTW
uniref:Uncharacterized protein n=1 Tax=Rhizophora mucronata TaxID=61149 RepID=A0A2P2P8C5_RHIMU